MLRSLELIFPFISHLSFSVKLTSSFTDDSRVRRLPITLSFHDITRHFPCNRRLALAQDLAIAVPALNSSITQVRTSISTHHQLWYLTILAFSTPLDSSGYFAQISLSPYVLLVSWKINILPVASRFQWHSPPISVSDTPGHLFRNRHYQISDDIPQLWDTAIDSSNS